MYYRYKHTFDILLLKTYIEKDEYVWLREYLKNIHSADIAEAADSLTVAEIIIILKSVSYTKSANILSQLHVDFQKQVVDNMWSEDIAHAIEEMDTDDAADILSELDEEKKDEIFSHIHDKDHIDDIEELSAYDEDTAGSLMAKEYVQVQENWIIEECLREVRRQAQEVERVHSIYLVDSIGRLTGRVSLKDLISAPSWVTVSDIKRKRVDSVYDTDHARDVALLMEKYDMEAVPVINESGKLLGRITIDDVIDYVRETAEENYNLASWLLHDSEASDGFLDMIRSRLPWLFIALIGWFFAVRVMGWFSEAIELYPELFFFTPLIAAMAWNAWVQSSAIIVQWLANGSITGTFLTRFPREILLGFFNGVSLALVLFWGSFLIFWFSLDILLTVSIALVCVILLASMIGTFVPLMLHRFWVNPAVATGPFITTSNDIFGILIYFSLAKIIIWF